MLVGRVFAPEPVSIPLLGVGLAGVGLMRKRLISVNANPATISA
jgi:hypothetical protein